MYIVNLRVLTIFVRCRIRFSMYPFIQYTLKKINIVIYVILYIKIYLIGRIKKKNNSFNPVTLFGFLYIFQIFFIFGKQNTHTLLIFYWIWKTLFLIIFDSFYKDEFNYLKRDYIILHFLKRSSKEF
jgi:hypothetical protein